jgi:hypothetical protein
MRRFLSSACLLLLITGAALLNLHCASSSPTTEADDATEEPTGPAYTLLSHANDSLRVHHLHTDTQRPVRSGVTRIKQHVDAPTRNAVAFTYATPDSVHLARYTLGHDRIEEVDARAQPATYSIGWHPERNAFAYGVYTPTADGNRGPGTIRIAEDGTTRSVGCSASTEVLAWLPDAQLAVRNDDNLYLVAADGCATEATLDIRRHYHMTYDASRTRMAYIYRTLEYNREADAYQPDSTLYVSNAAGSQETRLFGDDRAPRHATWAPNTPELAASVLEDGQRRLVVYSVESDETTFLVPPATAPAGAQQHPHWSPTGDAVAFTLASDNRLQAAVRQAGSTDLLQPATGPVWGWVDAQTLVVPTNDGLTLLDLNGSPLYTLPNEATLVGAWPANAATNSD